MRKTAICRGMSLILLCVSLAASGCGKTDLARETDLTRDTDLIRETDLARETENAGGAGAEATKGSGKEAAPEKETVEETVKETVEETVEEPEAEPETAGVPWFEKGEWTDGVYSNSQAGISITLPEGWTAFTEEELKQVMNVGYDQLSEDQKKLYDLNQQNQQTIYDLGASWEDGQSSFFFLVENLGRSPISAKMSEETYLNVIKKQLGDTQLAYTYGDIMEREIAGNTWKVLPTECMGLVQWYTVHKNEKRMEAMIITVPDSSQEIIEDVLSHVKHL